MASPLAQYYGSDRAASAIGTRSDLVFHASLMIDSTVSTPQIAALSPIGAGIDLGRLPGSVAAYLSIKEAVVSTRKSPSFSDKHRAATTQSQTTNAPPGNTPVNVYFNTGNPTFFKSIGWTCTTSSTNILIGAILVKEHWNGTYYNTLTTINSPIEIAAGGPQVQLTGFFDALDGLINFDISQPGFDVQYTIANSTGANQTIACEMYGSNYSFDWTQLLVQYVDWYGQPYNVGIFDDRAFSQPFGLGQKIPFPITNENQTNFGSLSFTVLNSQSSFNTQYTYDVILNASLEYQLG